MLPAPATDAPPEHAATVAASIASAAARWSRTGMVDIAAASLCLQIGMMRERSTSHDLGEQIVGISSDKLCLPMAEPRRELRPAYTSPACSYPTMTSMTLFGYISPFAVPQCTISVYNRLGKYSDEQSRSERRASVRSAPAY